VVTDVITLEIHIARIDRHGLASGRHSPPSQTAGIEPV
jgi:hypothetical protein